MTDGEDLTKWQRKRVGLTTSAELVNLERDIPYAIRVAARTKVLTFMVHAENSSNCPAISFFRSFSSSPFSIQILCLVHYIFWSLGFRNEITKFSGSVFTYFY